VQLAIASTQNPKAITLSPKTRKKTLAKTAVEIEMEKRCRHRILCDCISPKYICKGLGDWWPKLHVTLHWPLALAIFCLAHFLAIRFGRKDTPAT